MSVSSPFGIPDNKVHGANMGPIWGRQDPDGPHVGPMNLVIWDIVAKPNDPRDRQQLLYQLTEAEWYALVK